MSITVSPTIQQVELGVRTVLEIQSPGPQGAQGEAGAGAPPVGSGMEFYGTTAPSGYLLCDGTAVSRTTYAALFAVISTVYGSGDGSTTFNLPDRRQRFGLGKAAAGTGSTLGGTGGSIDHTHSVPAHYHGMGTGADLNITASGDHTHNIQRSALEANSGGAGTIYKAQNSTGTSYTDTQSNNHTHSSGNFAGRIGLVTGGVDGNAAMTSGSNNPPYLVVNYIIKT